MNKTDFYGIAFLWAIKKENPDFDTMQVAKKCRIVPTTVRSLNLDTLLEITHFLEGEDVNDLFFVLRIWRCSPGEWVVIPCPTSYPSGGYLKDPEPHVAPY